MVSSDSGTDSGGESWSPACSGGTVSSGGVEPSVSPGGGGGGGSGLDGGAVVVVVVVVAHGSGVPGVVDEVLEVLEVDEDEDSGGQSGVLVVEVSSWASAGVVHAPRATTSAAARRLRRVDRVRGIDTGVLVPGPALGPSASDCAS